MALSVLLFLKKQPGFPEKIEKVGWGGGGSIKILLLKISQNLQEKKLGRSLQGHEWNLRKVAITENGCEIPHI